MEERREIVRSIRENIGLFGEIYRQISLRYVDKVNPETFLKAGIDGMLATLDPYTEYIEPEGTDDIRIMSQGRYGGVGLQIGTRGEDRILTVISPMEGTPAWRLGIRAGDQILEIDGETTIGFTTSDAAQKLRGVPGEPVEVRIRRFGVDDLLDYTIVREEIMVKDVSFSGIIEPGIGYIRLTRFSRQANDEVREAIENLVAQGMEGLIFDLRSNPGGLLPEAISVSENFLHPGDPIVSTKGRSPEMDKEFFAENSPSLPDHIPLAILVNQGSASASEIVSGAVQDLDRGVVIGKTSFGKGLVQSVINFRDNTALRITTAKYYTPSGRLIQKVDYFSDNEAILSEDDDAEEDSTFETSGGREVIAHGGIVPDIDIEQPEVGELVIALWRNDKYFDFTNVYMGQHPELDNWNITDSIYDEFLTYLDTTNFEFESEAERRLIELREDAEEIGLGEKFLTELEDLEKIAFDKKKEMYDVEKDDIMRRIKLEIASALAGSAGRVTASLEYDPQIQKAIEVLKEKDLYNEMLAGNLVTEEEEK
jgi:carboxyl-terminal processing protease